MPARAQEDHNRRCCVFSIYRGLRAARLHGALACLALGTLAPAAHAASLIEDATVHPALWPQEPQRALQPETEAFVSALLAHMTVEEKVAQMIQADIGSLTAEDLHTYKLGAVLAGGGAGPKGGVRANPREWLGLADTLSTALYFRDNPPTDSSEVVRLQAEAAERVSQNVDLRAAVPFRMPRTAYAMAALLLVAGSLFALRYAVSRTLDLKPPLARIL